MGLDVSIYGLRVKKGYTTTTNSGNITSSGAASYSYGTNTTGSGAGGNRSAGGTVRTTGDQVVSGMKIWDSSSSFNYDVSIAGDLYVGGNINGGNIELVNLNVSNDVSIGGDLFVTGEINGGLFGNDVSIGNNLWVTNDVTVVGDVSISGTLFAINASFNNFTTYDTSTVDWEVLNNAHIANNLTVNNDVSIVGNLYVQGEINGGLFGNDVSIGNNLFVSNNAEIVGSLVVSSRNVLTEIDLKTSKIYVDGSLSTRDGSINALFARPLPDVTKLYVDGSLLQRDVSIAWLNFNTWKTSIPLVKEASLGLTLVWNAGKLDTSAGISNLRDVFLDSSLANGDVLRYNSTNTEWNNQSTFDISQIFQSKATNMTPDSSGTGSMGDLAFDASYFYVCTSTNKWIRILGQGGY